jgi:hypothetical protein
MILDDDNAVSSKDAFSPLMCNQVNDERPLKIDKKV